MNHYSGSVPDTEPARAWLVKAACAGRNDLMFPDNNPAGIEKARHICRHCPVWRECLAEAFRAGDNEHGIRGALTPRERRALAKQVGANPIQLPKPKQPRLPRPKNLAEAVRRRTVRTKEGHLAWNGFTYLRFEGKRYTAFQAAFIVGHGREPVGMVRRTCGEDCFRADHLTDQVMRDAAAVCGTTAGFHRHTRQGEKPCPPCRRARAGKGGRVSRTEVAA